MVSVTVERPPGSQGEEGREGRLRIAVLDAYKCSCGAGGSREQRWGEGGGGGLAVLIRMVRKDPPEKLTFEEMPEGGEGMNHADLPKEDHSRQRP